jgi:glycosyl transferase family 8
MNNGAVYIITQDPRYVGLLLTSAASLKRAMPELPITVFSQFPVESPLLDKVVRVDATQDGFYDKSRLMRNSPYERTLFIDADTFVLQPIPELFDLLDQFDCAATHEEYLDTDWFHNYVRDDIPRSFPEFNTGILMLKRSEKIDALLEKWGSLYRTFLEEKPAVKINDQPFFRVAAYYCDVRIATLTREYNCKFRGQGYLNGPVKILHGHVDLKLEQSYVNRAAEVMNASTKPRVYVAGKVLEQKLVGRLVGRRKAHKVGSFSDLPDSVMWRRVKRLKEIVQEKGIAGAVSKALAFRGTA